MDIHRNGTAVEPAGVGPLLRRWREARRMSQLELALEAEVSARHISFLETGRAQPSKEMVLTLSNVLDVPLRERNLLLLAAGYAPLYGETNLDDPRMSQVRAAVEVILKSNEPRSAIAHDRHWNIVMANEAFVRFLALTQGRTPTGLAALQVTPQPRLNVMHLLFDPNGFRKIIVNWEQIAKSLLNEAYRRLAWARDDALRKLIRDILSYPGIPARWREPDLEAPHDPILPMELNLEGAIARMFSTVTTVATPHDVTLQELHVEVFYAADAETESVLGKYQQRLEARLAAGPALTPGGQVRPPH
ncbi:MAG TPA: helix-turn-helix transcriptional regulator [Candidatus Binataceae bacterium]|jgi:transcriptional regulator with XRE-family HTH domain|nr:helix-turn-helix transcriptional regulator [Candidatus Binataceae bacterium]